MSTYHVTASFQVEARNLKSAAEKVERLIRDKKNVSAQEVRIKGGEK